MERAFTKSFKFGKAEVKLVVTGSTTVEEILSGTSRSYDFITINAMDFSCAHLTHLNGPAYSGGPNILRNVSLAIHYEGGKVRANNIWSDGMEIPDVEILRHEVNALLAEYRPYAISYERASAARTLSAAQELAHQPPKKQCFFDTGLGQIFSFSADAWAVDDRCAFTVRKIITTPGRHVLNVKLCCPNEDLVFDLPLEEDGKCPKLAELLSKLGSLGY